MNTYKYTFAAKCPANGEAIIYNLTLVSEKRIFVEHIKLACALIGTAFHEDIAAILLDRFQCELRLTANHHGVEIETVLDAGEDK